MGRRRCAYSDDVESRFKGYHWNVLTVEDANDLQAVETAIREAHTRERAAHSDHRDTHIGYGSPHKQDKSAAHGEPLGVEEVKETKRFYGWPEDAQFLIPKRREPHGPSRGARKKLEADWKAQHELWAKKILSWPSSGTES